MSPFAGRAGGVYGTCGTEEFCKSSRKYAEICDERPHGGEAVLNASEGSLRWAC